MNSVLTQIFVSHVSYLVIINILNSRGHIYCFSNIPAQNYKPRYFWISIRFIFQLRVPDNVKNYLKPSVYTLWHWALLNFFSVALQCPFLNVTKFWLCSEGPILNRLSVPQSTSWGCGCVCIWRWIFFSHPGQGSES